MTERAKGLGSYYGRAYNRPLERGICLEGDSSLEELLGDEGYYLVTVTWQRLEGEAADTAKKAIFP